MKFMNHLLGEHEEELNEENYQSYLKGPICQSVRKNLTSDQIDTVQESRVLHYWLKKKIKKGGGTAQGLNLNEMYQFVQKEMQ